MKEETEWNTEWESKRAKAQKTLRIDLERNSEKSSCTEWEKPKKKRKNEISK